MITAITNNIKVSVETKYRQDYSDPFSDPFIFTYKVTIENYSGYTLKLLSRCWNIVDLFEKKRVVNGLGVLGRQPVLEMGQSHTYSSGCDLKSGIGKMYGYYMMNRIVDGELIRVEIPKFNLILPILSN